MFKWTTLCRKSKKDLNEHPNIEEFVAIPVDPSTYITIMGNER